jgi:hypothetical protein
MLHVKFYQLILNKKEKMFKRKICSQHKEVNATNHKWNRTPKVDNKVRQIFLRLRTLSLVGKASLLIFNARNVHQNYINWLSD